MIIADEGHKLKEGRTAQSKGMHKLGDKARYRLLLTGTPVANKELDIFSQYRFVNPDIFGKSFIPFRNRYFYMGGYEQHEAIFKKSMTGRKSQKKSGQLIWSQRQQSSTHRSKRNHGRK